MFAKKKQFKIQKEYASRIEKDIEDISLMNNGIFAKIREFELGYYITVIIDREKLNIKIDEDKKEAKIPELVNFLIIVDYLYPESTPKILAKTAVIFFNNIYNLAWIS